MSDLSRIEKLLENMSNDISQIKEDISKTARHDDVMAMRETLESIVESSVTHVDDKREAGEVLLKSHFDHAYTDIKETKAFVQQGFEETAENFQQLFKIMETWLDKQKGIDEIQRFQHERIVNQEKQTEFLWKEVNRLKRKVSGDSAE